MSDTTSKGGGQIATPLTEGDELGIDIFTSGEWLVEQGIEAIIKLCTQPIISSYQSVRLAWRVLYVKYLRCTAYKW